MSVPHKKIPSCASAVTVCVKKAAPLLGPDSKEARWKVKSGKVMQGAVPPIGTSIRELSRTVEERDSHFLCLRPLCCRVIVHLPDQNLDMVFRGIAGL